MLSLPKYQYTILASGHTVVANSSYFMKTKSKLLSNIEEKYLNLEYNLYLYFILFSVAYRTIDHLFPPNQE